MKKTIRLKRVNNRQQNAICVGDKIERIVFNIGDEEFVITPDFEGFRIHKSDGRISIQPCVSNEFIVF